ncbi:MAG: DUF4175 domain-containing protein [Bacteroidales bacterium]|nr:DUF4175 domain-containing protein [Lachnoclostridium sp.]MCM1385185.1 DUF4175 domain-containing protein [Lachnoclostridium sp.]MCM1466018.1 DUF4175 domain-containing protein [Bacteroidales bacterium]
MEQEFLKIIRACRNRLNMAGFLKKLIFALSVGMGVGIVFELAAFLTPFYYADFYVALALILAVFSAIVAACVRQNTMEQAALAIDRFGFQERIITAYENLDKAGSLVELQREDAIKRLLENREKVKISLWRSGRLSKKELLGFPALCLILLGLMLAPSAMKDRAEELHAVEEIVKEKEQEIEEVKDSLEQLLAEELTLEERAALQEMIESLQSSLSEYEQAASAEMLSAAEEKLDYKYDNMSSRLSELADTLQNGGAFPADAEAMQAMADKLKEMGGEQLAQNQDADSQKNRNNKDSQTNGNSQNGGGGQGSGDGQSAQGSQKNQEGQGRGDSQNGQVGQENGDGQGGGDGEGQSGQVGQNSGDGEGSDSGRGTGSSNTQHDYVSVPNAVADSENLTGSAVDHDNSDYFRAQNGLAWEGTHISPEAVLGSYERHAYEGIATGRYPSGMEDVIKEYFASFN